jgi:hypothetical protein
MVPRVCEHYYEGVGIHTFYPSGILEDPQQDGTPNVLVTLNRAAITTRIPLAPTVIQRTSGLVVESVRGSYFGFAYVNLQRLMAKAEMSISPGEVQLSSPHHHEIGHLTNTYLFGTFKGKLSDTNRDGSLDLNTERCHGTVQGELDRELDGVPDCDPFETGRRRPE